MRLSRHGGPASSSPSPSRQVARATRAPPVPNSRQLEDFYELADDYDVLAPRGRARWRPPRPPAGVLLLRRAFQQGPQADAELARPSGAPGSPLRPRTVQRTRHYPAFHRTAARTRTLSSLRWELTDRSSKARYPAMRGKELCAASPIEQTSSQLSIPTQAGPGASRACCSSNNSTGRNSTAGARSLRRRDGTLRGLNCWAVRCTGLVFFYSSGLDTEGST